MNILETITERTKERIRGEKKQIPINEIRKKAEDILKKAGFLLITEQDIQNL